MRLLLTLALATSGAAFATPTPKAPQQKLFKVTVQNLTKGQPITPPVVAVHAPQKTFVKLGEAPSAGLSALAKDGVTSALEKELKYERYVVRSSTGKGVILPGKKDEIMIEANHPKFQLTVVGMLARTNDAITVAKNLTLPSTIGMKAVYYAHTYDAGAELNTELCSDIPAPPCESPMQGPSEGEGFIRPHEGITYVGDLTGMRDAFSWVSAKITVERIQ